MIHVIPPASDRDRTEGPIDAPVTLTVHGDFERPCYGEANGVIKAVRRAMGDRLRLVFRHGHAAVPSLFINGVRYGGDRDVASLIAAIDAAAGARYFDGSIERLMLV